MAAGLLVLPGMWLRFFEASWPEPSSIIGEPTAQFQGLRLRSDHATLDALWAEMRACLCAIAEGRQWHLEARKAQAFAAAYDRHIAVEESQLLPLARRLLDDDCTRRLGQRMADRRGGVRRTL